MRWFHEELPQRLNCTDCGEFTEFDRVARGTVDCSRCGKRHSNNSLYVVRPEKKYHRDDDGNLLEEPP